jgi:ABC-type glutathione transport system ATPase component
VIYNKIIDFMLSVKIDKISITNTSEPLTLLHDINFSLPINSVYTVFGSNGSGKSTLLKAIMNVLNQNVFNVKGEVQFEDTDLLSLTEKELNEYRKSQIKIVFQDAANCFDPLRKLKYYFKLWDFKREIDWDKLLNKFLLPGYSELSNKYPYEISIGQAQRLNFALAYAVNPRILLLDEPTSALDVINNNLFKYIIEDYVAQGNNSVLLVTHDLSFAKEISSKMAVLRNSTLSEFVNVAQFDEVYQSSLTNYFSEE